MAAHDHDVGIISHVLASYRLLTGSFLRKYYIDEDDRHTPLFDSLWAYEGVVLPGGMIILGRWWFPDPNASEVRRELERWEDWHLY